LARRCVFGDVADEAERARLHLLEAWADLHTIGHLRAIGVRPVEERWYEPVFIG
jgi:hypothetical protein